MTLDKEKEISCADCPAYWLHCDSDIMFKWLDLKKKEIEDMMEVKGFFLELPSYFFFRDFDNMLTGKEYDKLLTGDICCKETIDFFKSNNIVFTFFSVVDIGNSISKKSGTVNRMML